MDFTQTENLNKTLRVKPEWLEKNRKWIEIDATDVVLGKLATVVANLLVGKWKSWGCDFWDAGDFVVIKNIEKITASGQKMIQKMYYRYSGYKGNLKSMNLKDMMEKHPERALRYAVRGMLPKNKLRDRRLKRLKIFTGANTKFDYRKPEQIVLK